MRPVAFFAACIAAAAAVPARAQTTPSAPADSAVRAAPPAAPASAPRVHRNPNLITTAELEGQTATDVYQLVMRLRPQWLRARPSGSSEGVLKTGSALPADAVAVFIDGSHAGTLGELRRLQVTNVRELRFYPSADAIMRWGRDYSGGVIEVAMR